MHSIYRDSNYCRNNKIRSPKFLTLKIKWSMYCYHVFFGVAAIAIGFYIINQASLKSMVSMKKAKPDFYISQRDGVIFISDGAKGTTREVAFSLAKMGCHVLIGVKTVKEKKTFSYELQKGIESIIFDIADPSTLSSVIYRLREIRRDLDRPLTGVIINLSDFMEEHWAESHYIDIELLDINYKALLKGPVRLVQSMLELVKYQKIEDDERASNRIVDQRNMVTSGSDNDTLNRRLTVERNVSSNILNAQGLRIVTLTGEMSSSQENQLICGSKCVLQNSFVDFVDNLISDDHSVTNISLSVVHSLLKLDSHRNNATRYGAPSIRNKHYRRGGTKVQKEKVYFQTLLDARLESIRRYLDNKNDSLQRLLLLNDTDKKGVKANFATKALVHAMTSSSPLLHYAEEVVSTAAADT